MTETAMNQAAVEHLIERFNSIRSTQYQFTAVQNDRDVAGHAWSLRVGHTMWTRDDGSPDYLIFRTREAAEQWFKLDVLCIRSSDPLPSPRGPDEGIVLPVPAK